MLKPKNKTIKNQN